MNILLILSIIGSITVSANDDYIIVDHVKFLLYYEYPHMLHTPYLFQQFCQIFDSPHFHQRKETVLYFHGWLESPNAKTTKKIVHSHLEHGGYNLIVLDWSKLVAGNYAMSVDKLVELGDLIAEKIFSNCPHIAPHFHIVGFSLGAQLAGSVGYNLQVRNKKKYKLKRITGLDPAGSGFVGNVSIHMLCKDDANFVDIIHTDSNRVGVGLRQGHIDFWPNGGARDQPGCTSSVSNLAHLCSHIRSVSLYAESVSPNSHFLAVPCASWDDFKNDVFQSGDTAIMGAHCNSSSRNELGTYYLQTNARPNYSRRANGIKFNYVPFML